MMRKTVHLIKGGAMSRKHSSGLLCLALILAITFGLAASESVDVEQYRAEAVKRWEKEVEKLEARDEVENHPDDSILFVGSSSIRRWEAITTDMAPYHPIQRGFGGSKWSDVAVFAERLITPHKFRGVVFFVANDIVGGEGDKTPEQVARLFAYVLGKVREHNPTVPVFFIAVTPTPRRWKAWSQSKAANTAVRLVCNRSENTYFIGTESIFLDEAGKPRPELFVEDQLHQNRNGYILWAAAIKSHLDAVLDGVKWSYLPPIPRQPSFPRPATAAE